MTLPPYDSRRPAPVGGPSYAPPKASKGNWSAGILAVLIVLSSSTYIYLQAQLPDLGTPRTVAAGVEMYDVLLPGPSGRFEVQIYRPTPVSAGKLPCIVIAHAGTRLFHGSKLGPGDSPEHIPYARAGYVVVAYEIDGDLPEKPSDFQVAQAASAFRRAEAGTKNERLALDYALSHVREIDATRIYSAGHSSAATLSLLVAETDPRIRGCVAYAPISDITERLGPQAIAALSGAMPGFDQFLTDSSPITHANDLRCPLCLFRADDDSNVAADQVDRMAAAVRQTNSMVTYVHVPTGDHYESMIQQGIPAAIEWLRGLR